MTISNSPRQVVPQSPAPKDGVIDTMHYGETAYAIRFNGETLGMVWGVRGEAEENLRALRKEITPEEIFESRTARAKQAKAFASGVALGHRT